jgi:gluconolactonase
LDTRPALTVTKWISFLILRHPRGKNGNLYSSVPGGVWIISPAGKHLVTIDVPERVSNVAWGDKEGKTLYITASTSLYRLRLKLPGMRN